MLSVIEGPPRTIAPLENPPTANPDKSWSITQFILGFGDKSEAKDRIQENITKGEVIFFKSLVDYRINEVDKILMDSEVNKSKRILSFLEEKPLADPPKLELRKNTKLTEVFTDEHQKTLLKAKEEDEREKSKHKLKKELRDLSTYRLRIKYLLSQEGEDKTALNKVKTFSDAFKKYREYSANEADWKEIKGYDNMIDGLLKKHSKTSLDTLKGYLGFSSQEKTDLKRHKREGALEEDAFKHFKKPQESRAETPRTSFSFLDFFSSKIRGTQERDL